MYSKEQINKKFNDFYLNLSEYEECFNDEEFYIPIHGNVENDAFLETDEKNIPIWKTKKDPKNKLHQLGIVDSFSTFQNAYVSEEGKSSKLLSKIIHFLYKKTKKLFFLDIVLMICLSQKNLWKFLKNLSQKQKEI